MNTNATTVTGVPRDTVSKRAAFHKQLTMRADVVATEYSDLGFRVLAVALNHEDGLPEHVLATGRRLGYEPERLTDSVYELVAGGSV